MLQKKCKQKLEYNLENCDDLKFILIEPRNKKVSDYYESNDIHMHRRPWKDKSIIYSRFGEPEIRTLKNAQKRRNRQKSKFLAHYSMHTPN